MIVMLSAERERQGFLTTIEARIRKSEQLKQSFPGNLLGYLPLMEGKTYRETAKHWKILKQPLFPVPSSTS
ncbi:MAG: hypothetical protein WC756_19260 [Taibaiella sp.]|jgi:hypothetical protein